MGSSDMTVSIASHRRRRLVAIMLRGDVATYDATPGFKAKVDRLIDDLLESSGQPQASESWDDVADRVIARFAHRLPESRAAGQSLVVSAARAETFPIQHVVLSFCSA